MPAQWMHITNTANGKSAYGMVRDECPGCGSYDIGEPSSSALRLLRLLDERIADSHFCLWHVTRHEPVSLRGARFARHGCPPGLVALREQGVRALSARPSPQRLPALRAASLHPCVHYPYPTFPGDPRTSQRPGFYSGYLFRRLKLGLLRHRSLYLGPPILGYGRLHISP